MSGANQFDVAVIGGGLVGTAIAGALRALRPRLVDLEDGDVAHRASRGSPGQRFLPAMDSATASATSMPSTPADRMPPAYPAPSPAG